MIKGRTPVRGWLQTLVKDGDDVRSLVVAIAGEGCVMLWVGLVGDAEGMAIEGWQFSGVCGNGCVAGGVGNEV